MPNVSLLPLPDVLHRLAPESWLAQQAAKDRDFDAGWLLLAEGDMTLDTLSLDFPVPLLDGKPAVEPMDEECWVVGLLVTGNLHVRQWIANREVDGAPGLQVLGNLRAGHVLVGGQEIMVRGDLDVDGLYWGDYNHGDLHVLGNMRAAATAFTEEYHVKVEGACEVACPLNHGDPRAYADLDPLALRAHLAADCYEEQDEGDLDELCLLRGAMLARVDAGRPLLDADLAPPSPFQDKAPFLFGDGAFAAETLAALPALPFLPVQANADDLRLFQFGVGEERITILCYGAKADDGVQDILLYQCDGKRHWMFCREPAKPAGTLGKLFGKPVTRDAFTVEYLPIGADTWVTFDAGAPPEIRDEAHRLFPDILHAISAYAHFSRVVTPERVDALLALPIVRPYDDWWDVDRNGFWLAELRTSFRQDNARHDGELYGPVLQLSREVGDDVFDSYRWHVVDADDGTRGTRLWYSPDNNNDDIDHEDVTGDLTRLCAGVQRFLRAEDLLQRAQERLESGTVPSQLDEDDNFAIRAWHAMGYPVELPDEAD